MEKEIDLKSYLEKLMKLEAEKQRLENIKQELIEFKEKNLNNINREQFINNIDNDEIEKLEKRKNNEMREKGLWRITCPPTKPSEVEKPELKDYMVSVMICFIIFAVGLIGGLAGSYFFSVIAAFGFIFFIISLTENIQNYKKKVKEYDKYLYEIEEYPKEMNYYQSNNKEFDEIEDKYNQEIKKITEEKIDERKSLYKIQSEKLKIATNEISELTKEASKNIEEITKKLDELYSLNIIFEKYRNLIAISLFYEYIISSRVTELEGKDGAYNLYESEMRQNVIIVELEKINENLQQVKNNQYCMYCELQEINNSIQNVNKSLKDIKHKLNITNAQLNYANKLNENKLKCMKEINKNISTLTSISVADFLVK